MLRIIIVEDEPMAACDLAAHVGAHVEAETAIVGNVADALTTLAGGADFVFLDVSVDDGETYELARMLCGSNVPFAFATGRVRSELPADLRFAPILAKPFRAADVPGVMSAVVH